MKDIYLIINQIRFQLKVCLYLLIKNAQIINALFLIKVFILIYIEIIFYFY